MEAHAAESHGLRTSVGAQSTSKTTTAVGKPSPPVRVRNEHSGAAILDSPGKKNSGSYSSKSDPFASNVLKKTKAKLCATFNIKVDTKREKTAGTSDGAKKSRGRPKKIQPPSDAGLPPAPAVVSEKDDTMCEQCGKQIPDFEEFFEHINTDHTESCSICFMAFVHEFYLREHKYLRHGGARPPISDRPPSPPPRSRLNNEHSDSRAGHSDSDSEEEEMSDDIFPGISQLILEEQRLSPKYRIPKLSKDRTVPFVPPLAFPCDDCAESFSTAAGLVNHLQERHYDPSRPSSSSSSNSSSVTLCPPAPRTSKKELPCYECGQSFATSTALNAHLDTHLRKEGQSGGARLQEQACHMCGKRFPRDRIGQHLLKSHPDGRVPVGPPAASAPNTGDSVMTCDLCDREFRHVHWKITYFFVLHKEKNIWRRCFLTLTQKILCHSRSWFLRYYYFMYCNADIHQKILSRVGRGGVGRERGTCFSVGFVIIMLFIIPYRKF